MSQRARPARLHGLYYQYLADQDFARFDEDVAAQYSIGTLERLSAMGDRMTRRAAVLALGRIADYSSNAALGRALHDDDRGVRLLAESGIRHVWCRVGTRQDRKRLDKVILLNGSKRFAEALEYATRLIEHAPEMSECWNQRAVALFGLGRYSESIRDCSEALEINAYHFGAAAGMGQCYLKLNQRPAALECFRRALKLNPNLEGVRAHVLYLQRTLKSQD